MTGRMEMLEEVVRLFREHEGRPPYAEAALRKLDGEAPAPPRGWRCEVKGVAYGEEATLRVDAGGLQVAHSDRVVGTTTTYLELDDAAKLELARALTEAANRHGDKSLGQGVR